MIINRVILGGISFCFWTLLQEMKWTEKILWKKLPIKINGISDFG